MYLDILPIGNPAEYINDANADININNNNNNNNNYNNNNDNNNNNILMMMMIIIIIITHIPGTKQHACKMMVVEWVPLHACMTAHYILRRSQTFKIIGPLWPWSKVLK